MALSLSSSFAPAGSAAVLGSSSDRAQQPLRIVAAAVPRARRSATVVADGSDEPQSNNPNQGWFFRNFVETWEGYAPNRRAKMLEECAARQGKVDTLFENSFKYTAWLEVHRVLTAVGQKSIPAKEALDLAQGWSKAVLMDIREPQDFEKSRAEGSVNVPLFRLIEGSDLKANMRRLGYALLTDFAGTERNPEFVAQALAAVGGKRSRPVVVMCARGGSLDNSVKTKTGRTFTPPERLFGSQSRSLKACYELREAGFTNVYHLKGGLNQWFFDGYP